MKLVQLLAKELKEWPEGAKYACQDTAGTYEGSVFFVSNEPEYSDGSGGTSVCGVIDAIYNLEVSSDAKINTVTKSQWQAEREKMNKPKWIRHRGGKCPVKAGTKVVTRYRDGLVSDWCMTRNQDTDEECLSAIWSHSGGETDIMAYYVEETKDQEIEEVIPKHMAFGYASKEEMVAQIGEECPFAQVASTAEKTNFGTITYKLEIDATEATQQIDSLVAKWGQIESPLKWRDEIIELEAYEEEFRREREKLIRKLESEGFKLIDHAPAKCLLDEWEAMDYESFCVGDTVVCINEKSDDTIAELTIGKEYRLILDDEQICVIDDIGDPMRYCIEIGCFKLVKRA